MRTVFYKNGIDERDVDARHKYDSGLRPRNVAL